MTEESDGEGKEENKNASFDDGNSDGKKDEKN